MLFFCMIAKNVKASTKVNLSVPFLKHSGIAVFAQAKVGSRSFQGRTWYAFSHISEAFIMIKAKSVYVCAVQKF